MKFIVDAHLPPGLCGLLRDAGHDAILTLELPSGNQTADASLNALSMVEQRAMITKDSDFFHSHLLHGKPWKLLLVRTSNARTRDLKNLFNANLSEIIKALEANSIVEIDWIAVKNCSVKKPRRFTSDVAVDRLDAKSVLICKICGLKTGLRSS